MIIDTVNQYGFYSPRIDGLIRDLACLDKERYIKKYKCDIQAYNRCFKQFKLQDYIDYVNTYIIIYNEKLTDIEQREYWNVYYNAIESLKHRLIELELYKKENKKIKNKISYFLDIC